VWSGPMEGEAKQNPIPFGVLRWTETCSDRRGGEERRGVSGAWGAGGERKRYDTPPDILVRLLLPLGGRWTRRSVCELSYIVFYEDYF
jgi:hypothetical protein